MLNNLTVTMKEHVLSCLIEIEMLIETGLQHPGHLNRLDSILICLELSLRKMLEVLFESVYFTYLACLETWSSNCFELEKMQVYLVVLLLSALKFIYSVI